MRTIGGGIALALALSAGACKVKRVRAPYQVAPAQAALMDLTVPQLQAVQVPRAKVRQNASPSATLEFAAQSPERFAGKIQVAGQELLSLAVNENEYGLRYVASDGLAPGFYTGPPSDCAVKTLLGVSLKPKQLVAAMLGGAPLIDAPHTIVAQHWDSLAPGYEVLTIRNGIQEQELRFQYLDGQWRFAGTSVYAGHADARRWSFTLRHDELDAKGIPTKTVLSRHGRKRNVEVTIKVLERIENPPAILQYGAGAGGEEGDPFEEGGWEDADGEDGWEDDGWEEVAPEENLPQAPPLTSDPPSKGDGLSFVMTIAQSPTGPAPGEIPPVFKLSASGLVERGDLCRQ